MNARRSLGLVGLSTAAALLSAAQAGRSYQLTGAERLRHFVLPSASPQIRR